VGDNPSYEEQLGKMMNGEVGVRHVILLLENTSLMLETCPNSGRFKT